MTFFVATIIILTIIAVIMLAVVLFLKLSTRDRISKEIEKDPNSIILEDWRENNAEYNGHKQFKFYIRGSDETWIRGVGIPRDHSKDKEGKRKSIIKEYPFEFKRTQLSILPRGLYSLHEDIAYVIPEITDDLNQTFKNTPIGMIIERHIGEVNHLKAELEMARTGRKEKLSMEMENRSLMKSDENVVNRIKKQQIDNQRPQPMFGQNQQQPTGGEIR